MFCIELDFQNPMQNIPPPRFQKSPIETFTKKEIDALLKACTNTREAETRYRSSFSYIRPTAKRDQAIILTLLDTGLRAMELCSLKINNVDMKNGRISVEHGAVGGAKGGKGRIVFLGKVYHRRGDGPVLGLNSGEHVRIFDRASYAEMNVL